MKTKTHFAFRVDVWDDTGDSIVEHVAGVDDFEVAEATYRAAVARWPMARIRGNGWRIDPSVRRPGTPLATKIDDRDGPHGHKTNACGGVGIVCERFVREFFSPM
jgi:hypothetical protein